MKKLLLSLILLFSNTLTFSQIGFSSLSTSAITNTSASINAYVTISCANGGNFHAQYSTSPSFATFTNVTGGSVFASYARSITLSNLTPGTTYYWRYYGNLGLNCNQTVIYSPIQFFTTTSAPVSTLPTISGISHSLTTNSSTISYSLNPNNGATTSIIKYGLTNNGLTNQVTGLTASGTTTNSGNAVIPGLSANTLYYYQIEATNSAGTTTSSINSFTIPATIAPQLITEYNFDNTYNNVLGSVPFSSNAGTSFVSDRNGNPNSAINIDSRGSIAIIPNLPYGNTARTVSIWVKINAFNPSFNFIYCYGVSNNYNGTYITTGSINSFGTGSNHSISNANSNTWIHFVFTYDGTNSKIYKNGILLSTSAKNWLTGNDNDRFTLGLSEQGTQTYFNGAVDDLKIYNYALSDTEVTNLYTNNTLVAKNFNSQNSATVIYPNPATDSFTIEMANELKSATIYSLQGQRIMTSTDKKTNISKLSKGTYFVHIEDENNATSTQKLIIK